MVPGDSHTIGQHIVKGRWLVYSWVHEHANDSYFVLGIVLRVDGRPGGENRIVEHRQSLAEAKNRAQSWFEKTVKGVEESTRGRTTSKN